MRYLSKTIIIIGFLFFFPYFIFGQRKDSARNRSTIAINFECSYFDCNFHVNGNFIGDIQTLRDDNGTKFNDIGSDINAPAGTPQVLGNPIAYISGNSISISMNFEGLCSILPNNIGIRGISATGYHFPQTSVGIEYDDATGVASFTYQKVVSSAFDSAIPHPFEVGKVDMLDFEVMWQISIEDPTTWGNPESWQNLISTKNKIYVTLNEPQEENEDKYFEHSVTYFHIGCSKAKNLSASNAIIQAVWSAFENKDLTNHQGYPLKFYNPWGQGEDNKTPIKLLSEKNAQCTAWSKTYLNVLKAIGLQEQGYFVHIRPIEIDNIAIRFLVNDWFFGPISISQQFNGINPFYNANVTLGYNYVNCQHNKYEEYIVSNNEYLFGLENVSDLSGDAGQNSVNPQSDFSFHEVSKLNETYYDPSYGGLPFNNASGFIADYEDSNVSGYYKEASIMVDETDETGYGIDLNGVGGKTTNAIVKFMFIKPHIVNYNLPPLLKISYEDSY